MLGRFEHACGGFPNVATPMGEETGEFAVIVDSGVGGVLVDERGQRIEGCADRSGRVSVHVVEDAVADGLVVTVAVAEGHTVVDFGATSDAFTKGAVKASQASLGYGLWWSVERARSLWAVREWTALASLGEPVASSVARFHAELPRTLRSFVPKFLFLK